MEANTNPAKAVRRPRRHDPDRRKRLTQAAAEVLERDGILALNHRAVAAYADVPLGSITYHFDDLDGLLAAALEWISEGELRVLEQWRLSWDLREDLENALVDLVLLYTNDRRDVSILEYEVHVLAYRRPALRPLNQRWEIAFAGILRPHLSEDDIRLVIAMFDGIMLYGLGLDEPLDEGWARASLRKVLPLSS
ncbi:TetR/AcrR family transcriptional regulator [Paenarthrobacter sp. 2TAF44]|uniref:TetR/AcrR family transcriptional regulator n=1 Tax=Paenarthrobacter sp. 2TAF44 TaxID=3233018 RepID=UPI003F9A6BC9